MYQYEKVSSLEAMKLLHSAVQEAEKQGPVAVAVSGPEGELIAFLRMDGTSPSSSWIAQNKAYTAARNRDESHNLGDRMRTKDDHAFWGDQRITGFGGGFPIIQNSKVIGGIGVSGLPEEDDERIARQALKDVFGG